MTKQPLYSIIIPHYNSPTLLIRCLASIPDCEDIQVIVIDDNSSSDIVDFSHFPGTERKYTTLLFNKNNKGAGHARNLGLAQAQGKWLIFADADDYFLPAMWEIIAQYNNSTYDIIYLGINSVDSDTLRPISRCQCINDVLNTAKNNPTQENLDTLRIRHIVPWGKIIRKSLVQNNHILFEETKYSNDVIFSTYVALFSNTICINTTQCYCVTSRQGNLTSATTAEALRTRFEVTVKRNQILRQHNYKQHQIPIATYLYLALCISPKVFFQLICIGIHYHANFFKGWQRWTRKIIGVFLKHQKTTNPWQQ